MVKWKMWERKHQLKKIIKYPCHGIQLLERESNSKPQECETAVLTTTAIRSVIPNFKGRRSELRRCGVTFWKEVFVMLERSTLSIAWTD
jgi:hypothetical protein